MSETPIFGSVSTKLQRIAELARESPQRSFLSLAHHIDLPFLREAYRRTRKDGAPGVDGQEAAQYAEQLEGNLLSLLDRFKSGSYKAPPVRRVYIPKGDGTKVRPIGIPTFEDKVLQRAVVMVLEAVYEQDFLDCSYGFRPGRSAHQALHAFWRQAMDWGGGWVLEIDIQSFFDSVDHRTLRNFLDQRVRDGVLRRAIDKWLNAGVLEGGEWSHGSEGTPQGGVISPLLANLYLHWFDEVFHREYGPGSWAKARLVRYADDFVLMARYIGGRITTWVERTVEGWLGLVINRKKTRVVSVTRESGSTLDFLGYTFRYDWDRFGRRFRYLTAVPSDKARAHHKEQLRALVGPKQCYVPIPELVQQVNQKQRGWGEYFNYGHPRRAKREINAFVTRRLTKHLKRRSQRACRPPAGMTYYGFLTKRLGLRLL